MTQDLPHFRIIRPAAALFQADLFLAEWSGVEGFSKQVTCWRVRQELTDQAEAQRLLLADLKQAAHLSSPQITHILDVWREEEQIVIAMEHLAGVTLAQAAQRLAARDQLLPLEVVLTAGLEAARALEVAHEMRMPRGAVVHGDLRPQNIILGYDGLLKLTGFGFARFLPALTPRGRYCTWDGWCYQPGERLEEDEPDIRSDIFALGCVLYEAATGQRPYGNSEGGELLRRLQEGGSPLPPEPPWPGPPLDEDVQQVIAKACAPKIEARFRVPGELAQGLHALLYDRRWSAAHSSGKLRAFVASLADETEADDELSSQAIRRQASVQAEVFALSQPAIARPFLPRLEPPQYGFIGRREQLKVVGQALAGTSRSVGQAILVEAEAGLGRSRFLTEVGLRLSAGDTPRAWLHHRARMAEQSVAFSGVLRLLAPLLELGPDCTLSDIGSRAEHLRTFGLDRQTIGVIQSVAGGSGAPDPKRAAGLLSRGLMTALSSLVQEHTTVVAWDDLQRNDEGSWHCVAELVAQLNEMPLLVLLTATPDELPSWLLGDLTRVTLEPFTGADFVAWAQELIPETDVIDTDLLEVLRRRTGGNPLAMQETLQLLRDGDQLLIDEQGARRVDPDEPLPTLEAVMQERLEQMEDPVAHVAVAAALAGPALRPDILARATELDDDVVHDALLQLTDDYGLLMADETGLAFAHERHRRAVLPASPKGSRPELAGAVAQAILESTEPGGGLDDYAATLLADAELRGEAADVLFAVAEQCEKAGNLDSARQRYWHAFELARTDGTLGEAFELQMALGAGRTAFHSLRYDVADQALREAVDIAASYDDARMAAEAEILLLQLLACQGKLKETIERAKNAIPSAETAGDPLLLAQAYAAIGEAYQRWGQFGPDLRYIEAAVRFASQASDSVELGRFLQLAVRHAAGVGEYDQTQVLLDHARFIGAKTGDPELTGNLLLADAQLRICQRDFERAGQSATDALRKARKHGFAELEIQALHKLGEIYLRLELPREALFHLSESLRRARAARYDRMADDNEMYIGYTEAVYLGMSQGTDRVRRVLEKKDRGEQIATRQKAHELLGRALLAEGRSSEALPLLTEARRLAQDMGVQFVIEEAEHWVEFAQQRHGTEEPGSSSGPDDS
jgi:serine/threonine protein kinase/tetratricopeptide (TPR) repeat protein